MLHWDAHADAAFGASEALAKRAGDDCYMTCYVTHELPSPGSVRNSLSFERGKVLSFTYCRHSNTDT
jgi:hypothetical protein